MKTLSFVPLAFAFLALGVQAQQDPGPSPTESVGCVAHNDHWDCEGPASTAAQQSAPSAVVTTTTSPAEGDDDHSTANPGPSPTESVGCVAHNDHWDCEGPATAAAQTTTAATTTTTMQDHDADQHAGTSLPPSPTASVGCVAHGDHWDCEGPASATSGAVVATTVTSAAGVAPVVTETHASVSTTMMPSAVNASSTAVSSTTSTQTVAPFTGGASQLQIKSAVLGGFVGGLVLLYTL